MDRPLFCLSKFNYIISIKYLLDKITLSDDSKILLVFVAICIVIIAAIVYSKCHCTKTETEDPATSLFDARRRRPWSQRKKDHKPVYIPPPPARPVRDGRYAYHQSEKIRRMNRYFLDQLWDLFDIDNNGQVGVFELKPAYDQTPSFLRKDPEYVKLQDKVAAHVVANGKITRSEFAGLLDWLTPYIKYPPNSFFFSLSKWRFKPEKREFGLNPIRDQMPLQAPRSVFLARIFRLPPRLIGSGWKRYSRYCYL